MNRTQRPPKKRNRPYRAWVIRAKVRKGTDALEVHPGHSVNLDLAGYVPSIQLTNISGKPLFVRCSQ